MLSGISFSSPYTDRVKMVIIKNKKSALKQWHFEERNIYKDYIKAFGEEPNNVTSIAIMTDTDNTSAMAESYFGDIIVSKTPLAIKKPAKDISMRFNQSVE